MVAHLNLAFLCVDHYLTVNQRRFDRKRYTGYNSRPYPCSVIDVFDFALGSDVTVGSFMAIRFAKLDLGRVE